MSVRGKKWFLAGPLSLWSLQVLPMSVRVFSGFSGVLPHPQMFMLGNLVSSHCFRRNECGCGCEHTLQWKGVLFLPHWLQLPTTLNWNQGVGKSLSDLFLLIFLKSMDSSHLFQCWVLQVFEVLILNEASWSFCDQKYAVGTKLLLY